MARWMRSSAMRPDYDRQKRFNVDLATTIEVVRSGRYDPEGRAQVVAFIPHEGTVVLHDAASYSEASGWLNERWPHEG